MKNRSAINVTLRSGKTVRAQPFADALRHLDLDIVDKTVNRFDSGRVGNRDRTWQAPVLW
jgi:hypothetical protein